MSPLPGEGPPKPLNVKKIWVAMSTPFQANFFAPLVEELRSEYDFVVTARDHDKIHEILEAKRIDYIPVGKHGGRDLSFKLEAYAHTIQQLLPIVQKEKPDLLLTERWPEAVRTAFGLDIPSWTIFYDERETHVNQMVFPLASKVFAPRFYNFQELYAGGVTDPDKLVWFNGFHTGYLKGVTPNGHNPFKAMDLKPPVVFVRPEPDFASFFPNHEPVLEKAVSIIKGRGAASVAVLPRTETQMRRYSKMGVPVMHDSMAESPVAYADVTLGAAETMLMEAFVLGKPAVSAIYWTPSKPVLELHKYISHSTDPAEIAGYVDKYLDADQAKKFTETASLVVQSMDNPVRIMVDEIRRLNGAKREEVTFKRRSKIEIVIDIIAAASLQPLRPTHIMKRANISYSELKAIIDALEQRGVLKSESTLGGKYFQATPAGLRLLQDYRQIHDKLFA